MPILSENPEELRDWLVSELHILVVLLSDAWGGLEQVALNDVRLLVQSGFKVTMLVRENSPIDKTIRDESPQIQRAYIHSKTRNYFDHNLWKQLRKLIDQTGVNLIHCHQTSILGAIVPALIRRPGVALVVSRHILNSHNKKDPLHAVIYRRVDYVMVISETMKKNLAATFPIAEKKLRKVNLAINLEKFNPNLVDRKWLKQELNIPEEAFLVGLVGRIDPMKGQDLLVKALAQVRKSYSDVYGVIVGDETPGLEGKYLKELDLGIKQLHLENAIFLRPAQKDVEKVMAGLDLFVMPSWSEAFGLVALEAMALEAPCILARGGSAEEIAKGSGAELVRSRDAYDLARKIMLLRNSPDVRSEMKRLGRSYVLENHSRANRLQKTLEIYARCYRRRIYGEH
ncbi:MAG: glycosyltransferase [Oligoflexia bacterium]|nr:glycosyltransferase [Oligoflexia bacterium]